MSIPSKSRYKCPSCNSQTKAFGANRSGTKRYRCLVCNRTFTASQKSIAKQTSFVNLFEEYVLYGVTYKYLEKIYKINKRRLIREFHKLLNINPPDIIIPETTREESYLIIDGKWFNKTEVMMIYRRSDSKSILHISFLKREYGSQIAKDLLHLKSMGYRFTCVISDGGTGIAKAVKQVFGNIPHQICMAHTHRQATNCLGKYPKDECVRDLKHLADHIWLIESREALAWWIGELKCWYQDNWFYLMEKRRDDLGRVWFVHKNAKKSLNILLSSVKQSFKFLDHPLLPKTSNHIEASIGVFGDKKRIHRGLKRTRNSGFMKWFIYYYNKSRISLEF